MTMQNQAFLRCFQVQDWVSQEIWKAKVKVEEQSEQSS